MSPEITVAVIILGTLLPHIIQVPRLQVLILQVLADVAPRAENTVRFLMDLPLLIVALRLRNHIPRGERTGRRENYLLVRSRKASVTSRSH